MHVSKMYLRVGRNTGQLLEYDKLHLHVHCSGLRCGRQRTAQGLVLEISAAGRAIQKTTRETHHFLAYYSLVGPISPSAPVPTSSI